MMTPALVGGATVEELQAQIASLTAQLATLQAQLAAMGGGTPAGTCTFTRALYPGVSGTDVKCLQQYLNGAGFAVAASGVGSAGNETQYYGPLTQAAVKKWQDANGVVYGAYGGYFGPVSQAKYAALGGGVTPVTPVTPTGGAEGGILGTINSTPASGVEVYVSTTGVAVAAIDIKAIGDVVVNRLDLNFSKRPWLYITNVTVTDGTTSKTVAVTEAGTSEVTVGSSYLFRIDGLNISIPKDTTKTLTVKVDGVSALPGTETSTAVVITFAADCVRATDAAGIQQYAPTAALATRTFTAKEGDTANIEITANVDNPKARTVIVQSTAETANVVLAKINVKATNKDAILRTIRLTDANASSATAGATLKNIYLYDGDTQLSSTSSVAAVASSTHFTDIDLTIPKDTTKVLTVKGTISKASGNYVTNATSTNASSSITFEISGDGFEAEDATTFAAATVSGSAPNPGAAYFYTKAPQLSLASASINNIAVATGTITYNGKAGARIKVNVTAEGGDIYVSSSTSYIYDTLATSTIGASTTVVQSVTSNATVSGAENFIVYSGETKWVESYAELTRVDDENSSTVGDLATYVYLTMLSWQDADSSTQGSNVTQDWGLTDMKTGSIILEYFR